VPSCLLCVEFTELYIRFDGFLHFKSLDSQISADQTIGEKDHFILAA